MKKNRKYDNSGNMKNEIIEKSIDELRLEQEDNQKQGFQLTFTFLAITFMICLTIIIVQIIRH